MSWNQWKSYGDLTSKEFVCGYCGRHTGSTHGYIHQENFGGHHHIYICTNCGMPTLFFNTEQKPGPMLGRDIKNLPDTVSDTYGEIRNSIKDSSYTGAILLGRKLIMHLAVDIAKAKEGESFVQYVDHLKKSGYIPPNGDKILTFIKNIGNEKNHEIKIGTKDEAEKMLKFIEVLLIFIYEFPVEIEKGSGI